MGFFLRAGRSHWRNWSKGTTGTNLPFLLQASLRGQLRLVRPRVPGEEARNSTDWEPEGVNQDLHLNLL